ncbi:RING finger protein [Endozoicomonas euniceicola]|uniref:RING finger protein n=1 Tax=Endozoicomonas euniceicola TaxID=1234143 RepID=UPI00384F7CFF
MRKHCLICNITFDYWNNLPYLNHVLSHVAAKLVDGSYFGDQHTASIGYWYCKICGFRFSNRDKLQDHLMEQHEKMIHFCTDPFCNKNESGEAVLIEEYVDMAFQRLLASFCTADPERPPDSELKEYTWGICNYSKCLTKIETERCPICLTGLYLRPFRILRNCKHELHRRCLRGLIESGARNCPVCRAEMGEHEDAFYKYPDDPVFVL